MLEVGLGASGRAAEAVSEDAFWGFRVAARRERSQGGRTRPQLLRRGCAEGGARVRGRGGARAGCRVRAALSGSHGAAAAGALCGTEASSGEDPMKERAASGTAGGCECEAGPARAASRLQPQSAAVRCPREGESGPE